MKINEFAKINIVICNSNLKRVQCSFGTMLIYLGANVM